MKPIKIPAYRMHRPTGQAVVRLDGKDHYLGKYGTPESHEKYARVTAEWRDGRVVGASARKSRRPMTLRELYGDFFKRRVSTYYVKDGRPTGQGRNIDRFLRPVLELYGSGPASSFGPLDLKTARTRMVDMGWSRKVVNQAIGQVRLFFKWAVSEELYPAEKLVALRAVEPLLKGRTHARELPPVKPVPVEMVEAVLPHLSAQVRAMVELQLLTAARPGEVRQLRPMDVDRSGDVWAYTPESHKSQHRDKSRVILIGPKGQAVLAPWLHREPDAYCFQPGQVSRIYADGSAMPGYSRSVAGRPFTVQSYALAITYHCARAWPHPTLGKVSRRKLTPEQKAEKLDWDRKHRWHPNQLRHTAATAIRRFKDAEAAQTLLGHSRPDTTLIYAEADLDKARAVIREIG